MTIRCLSVATALLIASICPVRAEESLVAYKSLGPELALDLARAALANCRTRGYQVAVAVVDRFGVTQVMLRDRFAGPHTPSTAAGKAWTAPSFKTSTTELNAISQSGMMQAGIRNAKTELMKEHDRDAADASAGAGHQHIARTGTDAILFERHDR